jgi:hypothetical protein
MTSPTMRALYALDAARAEPPVFTLPAMGGPPRYGRLGFRFFTHKLILGTPARESVVRLRRDNVEIIEYVPYHRRW